MRYRLHEHWPLAAGAIGALGVLFFAAITGFDPFATADYVFGIDDEFWALSFVILAISFAVQLVVSNRAAVRRERNLVRTAAQLREVSAELDRLARTDALTGIANRRAFFDVLGVEFRRSRRYGRDLSVLMVDLDHFKRVNDRWGHPFGDQVLRQTADLITASVRESDIIGRYGGEEFAIALPETTENGAVAVAEKLRLAMEAHEFRAGDIPPPGEPPVRITVSVGVASLPVEEEQDEAELIGRADQALYEAKRTGRSRVISYRKVGSAVVTPVGSPTETREAPREEHTPIDR